MSTESLRRCLRDPIPEIEEAAHLLSSAVDAHLRGDRSSADSLIRAADLPLIGEWTESIWGAKSPFLRLDKSAVETNEIPAAQRVASRMPNRAEKELLRSRDGFLCRYCAIPVVRAEVRKAMSQAYPEAVRWGSKNRDQHSAFQAMWLQYDHVVPHSRGGDNSLSNLVVTCGPCNFGRRNYPLDAISIRDPRLTRPSNRAWDGLERFLTSAKGNAG